MIAVLLLILPINTEPVRDRVDYVEVNHHYDDAGRESFTQLIFRDYEAIVAWRMVRPHFAPIAKTSNGYYVMFTDSDGLLRSIEFKHWIETWTQAGVDGDPERNELEWWPECRRRQLLTPARVGAE